MVRRLRVLRRRSSCARARLGRVREEVRREVQEARHEPALGVVYVNAKGLDLARLVSRELESG